jgi:hypothetical protein
MKPIVVSCSPSSTPVTTKLKSPSGRATARNDQDRKYGAAAELMRPPSFVILTEGILRMIFDFIDGQSQISE